MCYQWHFFHTHTQISKYCFLSGMYLHNWLIPSSTSWKRQMMSHVGYLKLLISWSILSGPLDFEIKRVSCNSIIWIASSKFGTYRLCEQRRFRRACASTQSRQNLRCSLIQAVSQEEPSDRKPNPWPRWVAGHAQLKFVMTECSKIRIRLTGPIL